MRVTPLAADSLGARSIAALVETDDVTVLLDPGIRFALYRYELPPHLTEEERQKEVWRRVKQAAKKAASRRRLTQHEIAQRGAATRPLPL